MEASPGRAQSGWGARRRGTSGTLEMSSTIRSTTSSPFCLGYVRAGTTWFFPSYTTCVQWYQSWQTEAPAAGSVSTPCLSHVTPATDRSPPLVPSTWKGLPSVCKAVRRHLISCNNLTFIWCVWPKRSEKRYFEGLALLQKKESISAYISPHYHLGTHIQNRKVGS